MRQEIKSLTAKDGQALNKKTLTGEDTKRADQNLSVIEVS